MVSLQLDMILHKLELTCRYEFLHLLNRKDRRESELRLLHLDLGKLPHLVQFLPLVLEMWGY